MSILKSPGTITHFDPSQGNSVGYYFIGKSFAMHVREAPTKKQEENIKELLGWEYVSTKGVL